MTASSISDFVQRTAAALGFELCGVAPAEGLRVLDAFPAWIASGFHGEMQYLAARNEAGELKRAALENVAPWARSVIVCAVNYNTAQPYSTEFVAGDRTTPLKPKEGLNGAPVSREFHCAVGVLRFAQDGNSWKDTNRDLATYGRPYRRGRLYLPSIDSAPHSSLLGDSISHLYSVTLLRCVWESPWESCFVPRLSSSLS